MTPTENMPIVPHLVHEHEHIAYPLTDQDREALQEAESIKRVETPTDYEFAVETIAGLKKLLGGIERWYKPIKQAFTKRKQAVLDREYEQVHDPDAHVARIERLALDWRKAEQRREQEAKIKLEQEARQQAEEQRQRDVARLKVLADAQADERMKEGLKKEAELLARAPVIPSKVVIESRIASVKGTAVPKTWSAEVVDIKLLCKAVVDGTVNEEAVMGNMPFLNSQAVALKASMELVYPGVVAVESETISGRKQ